MRKVGGVVQGPGSFEGMALRRPLSLAPALAWLWLGCGPDRGPAHFIGERSAVVQCTRSGPHAMPPVWAGLPVPAPPSGLYAGSMDAISLDDLGFERDAVVCAMLSAPPAEAVENLGANIEALSRTRAEAGRLAMQAAGRCTCDTAGALGLRALIRTCMDTPTLGQCDRQAHAGAVADALRPLQTQLAQTPPPLLHWRVAGRSDRPGWFADHLGALLPKYEGGSKVFLRGQGVPRRHNHELLRRLLESEGVVAVVRQGAGQAVVVVRELGRWLVIDRFAYPEIDGKNVAMLAHWDNAQADAIVRLLAAPEPLRALALAPGEGSLVEIDRGLLQTVDRLIEAVGPLAPGRAEVPAPTLESKVDRITVQAPFGRDGRELTILLALSGAGQRWADGVTGDRLTPTLEELALLPEAPAPGEPQVGRPPGFLLRGTPALTQGFEGIEHAGWIFKRIDMEFPGTVGGVGTEWAFALPQSDLSGVFGKDLAFEGLRGEFVKRPYRMTATFEDDRKRMRFALTPK